ncbi:MAG TPA: type I restriction endonuclease subunit R [Methanothrix sp.]|nr:type I restriction endonuclease subunit R [Methanothrix sp.]
MTAHDCDYTEDQMIQRPAILRFHDLGWEVADCFEEKCGVQGTLGRETRAEVVLVSKLRPALERLNPEASAEAIDLAIEELTRDRSAQSPPQANREVYQLLKDGVKVALQSEAEADFEGGDEGGNGGVGEEVETVRLIDWNRPEENNFFLASQLWIAGEMYTRRADLVGFVNGIPLVFVELKASHRRVSDAYDDNLRDYKAAIPHLFWYNALIILSNGRESRLGSITSPWEHFSDWKQINSEGETGIISLDTMIKGTCSPQRLLDMVENFVLYREVSGGLAKIVAKNHQYLGVNQAVDAVLHVEENAGRLGVFWHTQGSGKSYSMVFFSQKVLRKVPGNWTFLVITDRTDLDGQIYKNFADVGATTEDEKQVRAKSGSGLKRLLREDHRYVFTLIQKFRTGKGGTYPKLTDRSDIIVITDEAHRSQYDIFAANMRAAIPGASFIGFTGTPLMAGEEKTREVFGDYVSIYNFKQSIDDGATVPLYYENRVPELQILDSAIDEKIYKIIEAADLDEAQERKFEREFAREYMLITRESRLDTIANDIVSHFMGRGRRDKAMVVSIDKATALRMYNKVEKRWNEHLEELKAELEAFKGRNGRDPDERRELEEAIRYMKETEMALVVSQGQNEIDDLKEKTGLDITPHRQRMIKEDLETNFKDENHPLRLVFVCAMWITGFDVPSLSTIYLDKPMRNHTLMQTIARANRVFEDKNNGLIVDYVGVFRNLEKALAIYAADYGSGKVDTPIRDKSFLVAEMRKTVSELAAFCSDLGIDFSRIQTAPAEGFERERLIEDAVEAILASEETKGKYLALAYKAKRLYKAILPDPHASEFRQVVVLSSVLSDTIKTLDPKADISELRDAIGDLLDETIGVKDFKIRDPDRIIDLSAIDFEALKKKFDAGRKRTEAERLKALLEEKLKRMVRLNKSRMNYLDKFQRLIDDYNSGSLNVEAFFNELIAFAQELDAEDKRAIAEGLSEEELAVFDMLTRPEIKLTKNEELEVKRVAKELLKTLRNEKLVLDWRKRQQSRAAVKLCIETVLDHLPQNYTQEMYDEKCEAVYQHVYESYYGEGQGIYRTSA